MEVARARSLHPKLRRRVQTEPAPPSLDRGYKERPLPAPRAFGLLTVWGRRGDVRGPERRPAGRSVGGQAPGSGDLHPYAPPQPSNRPDPPEPAGTTRGRRSRASGVLRALLASRGPLPATRSGRTGPGDRSFMSLLPLGLHLEPAAPSSPLRPRAAARPSCPPGSGLFVAEIRFPGGPAAERGKTIENRLCGDVGSTRRAPPGSQ